ncbi:MAG: type II toxin-antitoxin system VapC family toxin [Sphingomonas sp.]
MKITPDTNVLARALIGDDPDQAKAARDVLVEAELVALTAPALCELVWVLSASYHVPKADIAAAIRTLMQGANAIADEATVEAGLAALEAGGDFADAVIDHEGRWLGAETFVSFDRRAIKLLEAQGSAARLLG